MIKYLTIFLVNFLDRYIHQRKLLNFFLEIKENIKVVLDIGCHEGEYSTLFKKAFEECEIHAFEPNYSLKSKIDKKKLLQNKFNINFVAVSNNDGLIDMIIDKEISKISSAAKINYESKTFKMKKLLYSSNKNKDKKNTTKLKTIKLDSYLEHHKIIPDFVKIDVEGLEKDVLLGFQKNIQKAKFIMIEYHKDDLYEGVGISEAEDLIIKNNFKLEHSIKFPLMEWEDRIYRNMNI